MQRGNLGEGVADVLSDRYVAAELERLSHVTFGLGLRPNPNPDPNRNPVPNANINTNPCPRVGPSWHALSQIKKMEKANQV